MNSSLQTAITGDPVVVTLGGKSYPLAFPIQAVILYKAETAKLDRARVEARRQLGVKKLERDEIRELRARRRQVLAEAEPFRPNKGKPWDADEYAQFEQLMEEANLLKVTVDEEVGTGDSLFDLYNWRKIGSETDPERLVIALWTGLHWFENRETYVPKLTRGEAASFIDLSNVTELTNKIVQALALHLVLPSEDEESVPNATPVEPAMTIAENERLMKD